MKVHDFSLKRVMSKGSLILDFDDVVNYPVNTQISLFDRSSSKSYDGFVVSVRPLYDDEYEVSYETC